MTYDFTSVIDRRGQDAMAVDSLGGSWTPAKPKEGFDVIPMWVADMNFPTAPGVTQALIERAGHPAFGYFEPREEYYASIIRWQQRHGVTGLRAEHIGYENGVLGGLLSALDAMCSRGDSVLVHAPTYMGFTGSLRNAGYNMVTSDLVPDAQGVYRMDLSDMEQKLRDGHIHAAVFCSPHNPTGRVWERWEIEAAMALFRKYEVYVVSDEIWSDILLDGHTHIPTQSVSEDAARRTVALYAPSKTFNLAGLVGSYHIIYDAYLRDRVRRAGSLSHYNNMNVLSMHALIGAYTEQGALWVDELCQTLSHNMAYACAFFRSQVPQLTFCRPQGTYMLFLDCSAWLQAHDMSLDALLRAGWDVGVAWQDGRQHGGACHIRLNLALPFCRVEEAMRRLSTYVFNK